MLYTFGKYLNISSCLLYCIALYLIVRNIWLVVTIVSIYCAMNYHVGASWKPFDIKTNCNNGPLIEA